MAREVEINYFEVTVKLQRETDKEDKAGNPKIEKWNEKWLVHTKTSEEANEIVKKYYEGTIEEWRIAQIKETQILGVLDE
jgi:uncharacterized membrane protein YkoI